jgi:hypothetical protein
MFRSSGIVTDVTPQPVANDEPAPQRCGCGHLHETHDKIAARYCAATQTAGVTRGCICRFAPKIGSA